MDLESAVRELKMLADRERLSSPELERAKHVMVELKRLGMTNFRTQDIGVAAQCGLVCTSTPGTANLIG